METECTFYVELAEDVLASHIFLASLESRLFWRETEEGGLLIALCLGGLGEARRRRRERETQTHLSDSLNALVTLTAKPHRDAERGGAGGKLAPDDLTVAGGQLIAAAASLHTERLLVGKLCRML